MTKNLICTLKSGGLVAKVVQPSIEDGDEPTLTKVSVLQNVGIQDKPSIKSVEFIAASVVG